MWVELSRISLPEMFGGVRRHFFVVISEGLGVAGSEMIAMTGVLLNVLWSPQQHRIL